MKINLIAILAFTLCQCSFSQSKQNKEEQTVMNKEVKQDSAVKPIGNDSMVKRSDDEWKKLLPRDVYYVAREKGTERPWTSKYENFKDVGTYYCAVCGNALFRSDTKFDSGCGWPSFYEPLSKGSIIYTPDRTLGMERTEVQCGNCESHLGHVFDDGPPPTGKRYCINGVVLDFKKAKEAQQKYDANKKG